MPEDIQQTNYDLDLDTLAKPSKTIKIEGKAVEIKAPSLEDLISLSKLGGELQHLKSGSTDAKDMDIEQVEEAITKLRKGFADLVPELAQFKMNIEQLLALLDFVIKMAQPNDVAELEKRGISMDNDQKKTASDSSVS